MMKKIIAVILAFAALALTSCADKGTVALEYDGVTVTEKMYLYWMSHYKAIFMESYAEVVDSDEFWDSTVSDGMTAEEYFTKITVENVKKNIAAVWLFDYMGLSFTSDMKKEIKDGIEDLKTTLADGDDKKFAEMLAEYGIDEDTLYDVYVMDAKISYAYEYLYGSGGVISIPDSDKLEFTKENYVRIQHIYVNNNFKYITVENELGTLTHDPDTGEAYTEELTEAEKAEKNATVAKIDKAISDGDAFEDVWEEYSEDKYYANGYYLTKDTPFIAEVVDAAFELEIGETVRLETEYGVHYIKRYEIEGTPWSDDASKDFFSDFDSALADYVFTVMISETAEKVKVKDDVTGKYRLRDVSPNYYT